MCFCGKNERGTKRQNLIEKKKKKGDFRPSMEKPVRTYLLFYDEREEGSRYGGGKKKRKRRKRK